MFDTLRRVVFVAAAAAFIAISGHTAKAVVIDFDAFAAGPFGGGIEDGFLLVNAGGPLPGPLDVSPGFIPAVSAPHHIHHFAPGPATLVITDLTPGGLFTFGGLFAGLAFGPPFDTLKVDGFLGGGLVGTDIFAPAPGAHLPFAAIGLAGVTIDALHISFGPAVGGPTHVDDILLTRIVLPEPASLGLILLGLAGLGAAARRGRRR